VIKIKDGMQRVRVNTAQLGYSDGYMHMWSVQKEKEGRAL